MSRFGASFDRALDRHITGNYGEDQFSGMDSGCVCSACTKFFEKHSCNYPEECDCPECQGYCKANEEQEPELDGAGFDASGTNHFQPNKPHNIDYEKELKND